MSYPAGFHLVQDPGDTNVYPLPISDKAYTVGDCLFLPDGFTTWAAVTSTTRQHNRKAVCQETVASSAVEVKAILCAPNQIWVAETANNTDVLNNGDRMAFTDSNTVNNSDTDVATSLGCFQQLATSGAAADLRAVGQFVGLSGYKALAGDLEA